MSWNTIHRIESKIDAVAVTQTACSTGGSIVEDTSAGTPGVITVPSSASANTFGASTAYDASTAAAYYLHSLSIRTDDTTAKTVVVEVLVSTTTIARFSFDLPAAAMNIPLVFYVQAPIYIAASSAVNVKVADSEAGANDYKVSLQYFKAS